MQAELRKTMIEQLETRRRLLADEDSLDPKVREVIAADEKLISYLKNYKDEEAPPQDLMERVELRNYLNAYSQGLQIDGAEREMNQGLGLDNVSHVPWQAIAPLEKRTDDATAITIGDWGKNIQAILPRIFEKTDAGFLGITTPAVPAGTTVYPVMTGGTSATMKAANDAVEADVATFTHESVTPTRLSARYLFNLEGLAAMGNLLETTLRADLRQVMGDQFDQQIINGNGTSPNVSGVFNALAAPAAPGAEATWLDYRALATNQLDGKMANTEASVRVLLGLATWKHARTKFNTQQTQDGIQGYQALGGTIQNSARIPVVASKRQQGILTFEPSAGVAPVWQGVTIIRDPYTNAHKAQVALTAHMLFGFTFKRKDGWKRIQLQVEA